MLNYGVNKTEYYFSPYDFLLEHDNYKLNGSNIGLHGENLTITFLSLNRVELSLRLLNSIKDQLTDFKGEVLIIDNGSEKEQLEQLKEKCKSYNFNWRIEELDKNYGVAGGRNRTMPYVTTEWVLCLDNDIYFINNPIKKIQNDVSLLGCHFINLPLLDSDGWRLFALGGHIYVDSYNGNITVGGGSCFQQINYNGIRDNEHPFLSNFLFGGASLFRKDSFLKLGGYDENMFIGFEDIDFSIRLFREGMKIGNSHTFSLIHDHPKPELNADIDYEKKRFSANIIKNSALYLEHKYGYKIWDTNLVKWIEEKNKNIGNEVTIKVDEIKETNKKPKIALITDVDYWAFGNISRQVQKNLSEHFDFSLISFKDCDWNSTNLLLKTHDCDILHFFWREMIPLVNEEHYISYFGGMAVNFRDFSSDYYHNKILSTCVYDHLFLSQEEIEKKRSIFNQFNYYVCSEKLNVIYSSIEGYNKPKMVIEDGVDQDLFYPINLSRLKDPEKELVIGWVGNSKWASDNESGEDFKGFHTILKPAMEQLKEQGFKISGYYSDRNDKFIPHNEMVHYYSKIDVLICVSKIEGTPNPVMEAMACGIPVISTDVGIVPQVLGEKQREYILPERNIESLKSAILDLYHHRDKLQELSNENLKQIRNWFWSNQCQKFKLYFDGLLANR